MNWTDLLTSFDKAALKRLDARGLYHWQGEVEALPWDHNPVTHGLKKGDLVGDLGDLPGFGKATVSRLAVICQMAVYDREDGPDGDGKPKGLRRQWYAWFKVQFAQPFSSQLAEHGDAKEQSGFDGTGWAGRQSKVCGKLVDTGKVMYKDLWISDTSRMMFAYADRLFADLNLVIAVEKDSLVGDFKAAAQALGARSLVSGKGKQSKAATELQLREHFGWGEQWREPFSATRPLVVLHITDHDMDGEQVIGPTFGEQARRYTDHVLEARVGICPEDVDEWEADWYEVKTKDNGYIDWAEREGLFVATCEDCGHVWHVKGVGPHYCHQCSRDTMLTVKLGRDVIDQPHGFEVEALNTRAYYKLLVDALLRVLPFDYIVERLRDECRASSYTAARRILADRILPTNESYAKLKALQARIDAALGDYENRVLRTLRDIGAPHEGAYWSLGEDPEPEDFETHVVEAGNYPSPWRPFDMAGRTALHVDALIGLAAQEIDEYQNERVSLKGF